MGDYREFLGNVRERASALDTKARALNDKLKDAISALSHDPKLQPEGLLRLDNLRSLSTMIRDVRTGALLSRIHASIRSMEEADRKLAALDEDINRDMLAIHSSIFAGNGVPEPESVRLQGLFNKWQSTMAAIESDHASLERLRTALERAIESADALKSAGGFNIPEVHPPIPPAAADVLRAPPSGLLPPQIGVLILGVAEMTALKNLLLSIMGLYIHRNYSPDIHYCCAKQAACRVAGIPLITSTHEHKKYVIKDAAKAMEAALSLHERTGEERYENLAIFASLIRSCRAIYQQLPDDMQRDETTPSTRHERAKRILGLPDVPLATFIEQYTSGKFKTDNTSGKSKVDGRSALWIATGFESVFFPELFEHFMLDHFQAEPIDLETLEDLRLKPTTAEKIRQVSIAGKGIFYSEAQVKNILRLIRLEDYVRLISPMNFAHETLTTALPKTDVVPHHHCRAYMLVPEDVEPIHEASALTGRRPVKGNGV